MLNLLAPGVHLKQTAKCHAAAAFGADVEGQLFHVWLSSQLSSFPEPCHPYVLFLCFSTLFNEATHIDAPGSNTDYQGSYVAFPINSLHPKFIPSRNQLEVFFFPL